MKALEWLLDHAERRVKWHEARLSDLTQGKDANRVALDGAAARLASAREYQKRLKKDVQEYLDDWS